MATRERLQDPATNTLSFVADIDGSNETALTGGLPGTFAIGTHFSEKEGSTAGNTIIFVIPNVNGNRVRVMLEGQNYLHMAEVQVMASPVPEPASLAALTIGALALLRKRRR